MCEEIEDSLGEALEHQFQSGDDREAWKDQVKKAFQARLAELRQEREHKLADFIKDRKEFVLEGGKISMVRDDTSLKPLSVADQLEQILKENGPTMEVTALCSKFIQKFHVSVANVVQMRPLDFIMKEKTKFALVGNNMVTLKEFEKQEKAKQEKAKVEGSALRMARSRSPQTSRAPPPAPRSPR